jgi:hypothetical protein
MTISPRSCSAACTRGRSASKSPSEDFTICFCALLDGLAMIQLNQRPYLSRARLIELAMATARAQLAPVTPHGSRHA